MRNIFSLLLFILLSRGLLAQDILYSEKTIVSMWNENSNDWIALLERDDIVTFTLTEDHKTLLMYCKGSGLHFKYFYKENGEDMMWLSKDTIFYRIRSSEVTQDIDGNKVIKFITRSGVQNKEYLFNYYKKENLLHCIFNDANGRWVRNRFIIKTGSIK